MNVRLPKYVQAKRLKTSIAFYWTPPPTYRKIAAKEDRPFPFENIHLGNDLNSSQLAEIARPYNEQFEDWRKNRRSPAEEVKILGQYGSVRWLVETYLRSEQFKEKVSERSRTDYVNLFQRICALSTTRDRVVGDLPVKSISPRAADKVYARMIEDDKFRRGEKAVEYCRKAWAVIARLYPDVMAVEQHSKALLNPWVGVTVRRRVRKVKAAVDRDTVYRFAEAAIAAGRPEAAAAAVICFEWLQRPENVVCGYFRWSDYNPPQQPGWVHIEHHKTGVLGWHPLEIDDPESGEKVLCYPEAEAVLQQVPRRGLSVVTGPKGQVYKPSRFANIVRKIATDAGLTGFTLDACRHGGLTELEEAGLTEGQGMALSMHKTARIYRNYSKRTQSRAVGATLRRLAHRRANAP